MNIIITSQYFHQHKSGDQVATLVKKSVPEEPPRRSKRIQEAATKVIPWEVKDDPSVPKRRKVKVKDESKYCVLRHSTLISASLGTREPLQ